MTTKSTSKTLTKSEIARGLRTAELSREEELVLRMRHGISVPLNEPLEMMDCGNAELQAQLASMERATMQSLEEQGAGEKRNRNREKILETLKKLR